MKETRERKQTPCGLSFAHVSVCVTSCNITHEYCHIEGPSNKLLRAVVSIAALSNCTWPCCNTGSHVMSHCWLQVQARHRQFSNIWHCRIAKGVKQRCHIMHNVNLASNALRSPPPVCKPAPSHLLLFSLRRYLFSKIAFKIQCHADCDTRSQKTLKL